MTKRLSSPQLEELTPLLGPLARLVARGGGASEMQLQTLLLGSDLGTDTGFIAELQRWAALLEALRVDPTSERRIATEEALKLRGVMEASAVLATQFVVEGATAPPAEQSASLTVSPARLDFGTLKPGEIAEAELTVEGGSGEIICDSDQVTVSPVTFGSEPTPLRVRVTPRGTGTLWTRVRVVRGGSAVDVPIVALWYEPEPMPSRPHPQAAPEARVTGETSLAGPVTSGTLAQVRRRSLPASQVVAAAFATVLVAVIGLAAWLVFGGGSGSGKTSVAAGGLATGLPLQMPAAPTSQPPSATATGIPIPECPPRRAGRWRGTWRSRFSSLTGTWEGDVSASDATMTGSLMTGSLTLAGPSTVTLPFSGAIQCAQVTLALAGGVITASGVLDKNGANVNGTYQYVGVGNGENGVWSGSPTQ